MLIYNTSSPIYIITNSVIIERYRDLILIALIHIALLYNITSQDLIEEYQSNYKFTILHKTLLGINPENPSLRGHLQSLQRFGSLAELIDKPDLYD